jgi:MEKHLA domain
MREEVTEESAAGQDRVFARLLCGSFARLAGTELAPPGGPAETAAWLYHDAPFGLLAHDRGADPLFSYTNRTAQRHFEYDWGEFTGLPSRLSAEAGRRQDRDRLLGAVHEHDFAKGYRGLRIAKSGRRFWIEDVTMRNLVEEDGIEHGQAAIIPTWREA